MSLILLIICGTLTVFAVVCRLIFYKCTRHRTGFFWSSIILILGAELAAICSVTVAGCIMAANPPPLWQVNVAGVLALFNFLFLITSMLDEP